MSCARSHPYRPEPVGVQHTAAENLMQVYRASTPEQPGIACKLPPIKMCCIRKKLTKRVVLTAATGFRCRPHLAANRYRDANGINSNETSASLTNADAI